MGEVYKAHDGRLNRTVAIKRMIAEDNSRFESEARAIAAINHPHICQIYDVGPDYLVLEYLPGEPRTPENMRKVFDFLDAHPKK
jgi:serine/threonine protein kinase